MASQAELRLRSLLTAQRSEPGYEVIALRYGTCNTSRSQCFLGYQHYGEEDGPQQMDFFVWMLRNAKRTIIVDTGFDPGVGTRRERHCMVAPADAVELTGALAATVEDVVLTHLHYDHVGNLGSFPSARYHVQERELDFWSGPYGARGQFAAMVERPELDAIAAAASAGRVRRLAGDAQIAPGVVALWTGGHTPGHQIVAVNGGRSIVVLAADALHFYEELDRDRPFSVISDLAETYAAYDLLRELQAGGATILAGHDPAVLDRFPRLGGRLASIGVRAS